MPSSGKASFRLSSFEALLMNRGFVNKYTPSEYKNFTIIISFDILEHSLK